MERPFNADSFHSSEFSEPLITPDQSRPSHNLNKSFSKSHDKNYHFLTISLLEMGFESRMINRLYSFYPRVSRVEEMINLMSKEDEVWQHNFEKSEEDEKCLICGENSDHLNYVTPQRISVLSNIRDTINRKVDSLIKRNRSSFGSSSLMDGIFSRSNSKSVRDSGLLMNKNIDIKLFECLICTKECNHHKMFNLACNHNFCLDCWKDYLQEIINSGRMEALRCMNYNCEEKLEDEEVRKILTSVDLQSEEEERLIKKYDYFKLKQEILNSKDKKFCPVKDCDSYGKLTRNELGVLMKFTICENGHEFCFDCLKIRSLHKNISCEELVDKDFENWVKDKNVKQCPNCAFYIEKNEGCNHMTCVACKFQWCWLCDAMYTTTHYTDVNSTCYGRQFPNNNNVNNPVANQENVVLVPVPGDIPRRSCRNCIRKSLLGLLYVLFYFVLGALFSFPYLMLKYVNKMAQYEVSRGLQKCLQICVVPIAFVLQPAFIFLCLVGLALFIITMPYSYNCCKRAAR